MALDFDVGEGKLYWTDVTDNAIYGTDIRFEQYGSHLGKVSLLLFNGYCFTYHKVLDFDWYSVCPFVTYAQKRKNNNSQQKNNKNINKKKKNK